METLESRQMMTVTVNTLADVVDSDPLTMSLREAIAHPTDNSIVFDSSLNGGRIMLTQGELSINKPITITGPGADKLAIDASGASRVMRFGGTITNVMTVSGLTITGGNVLGGGGGIYNAANLTLNSVDVSGNVTDTFGGGVALQGGSKLTVYASTIHDNRTGSYGGGIGGHINAADSVTIVHSTISNNVAPNGGGLGVLSTHATPSTAHILLSRSTITQNTASNSVNGGGGVYNSNGATITSHGSIIAGNTALVADNSDIYGAFNLGSTHNVIGRPGNSGLSNTMGNRAGANAAPLDPKLSPLDNHGGPTKTHVPLPGSPALDAGGPETIYTPLTDQRGFKRLAERPENNVYSPEDIGAVELSSTVGPLGDFNGDGRDDQLLFDPTTGSLNVAVGAATSGSNDIESWGVMPSEVSISSTFLVGDFNGDGRDDVLIKSGSTFSLAISDGSQFFDRTAALPANSGPIYIGDFDGNGSDEILGGVPVATPYFTWSIYRYSDTAGLSPAIAVSSLSNFVPGAENFVQDINGDGHDDLVSRANAAAPWMSRLASSTTAGLPLFSTPTDSNIWIGPQYGGGTLDADQAIAKVIEEFSWVYNNVELELYPGLMKGPRATELTKAGNDWDQAALLEQRLQTLPFLQPDGTESDKVKIVSAKVRIDSSHFGALAAWLGATNPVAAFYLIQQSLDANAIPRDVNNGNSIDTELPFVAIEFTHAWVQAYLPTTSGMGWVDLDPSWKFKDFQSGIPLDSTLNLSGGTHADIGLFDEFEYFALDPNSDHRLPIEFFEDQVMDWLTANRQGASLADVGYDGPILQKAFSAVPAGLGEGVAVVSSVSKYSDFDSIADNPALAHRVEITLKKGDTVHWSGALSVPRVSLDAIQISFASNVNDALYSQYIAADNSQLYFSRLVVGGKVLEAGSNGEYFLPPENVTIEVMHLAPEALSPESPANDPDYDGPTTYDKLLRYVENAGAVISISLDANQHSHESLAAMKSRVLSRAPFSNSQSDLRQAIPDLTAYAGAKYWSDFDRYNQAISQFTGTIAVQRSVGSGIAKSDPTLLADASNPYDYLLEFLPFGMAPANFGVDLPHGSHLPLSRSTGALDDEASQLSGFNGSALEHNIVEEVIGAESISTAKGLQRAYQRNLGRNVNGVVTSGNNDLIMVFVSYVNGNTRTLDHRYNLRKVTAGNDLTSAGAAGLDLDATEFKTKLNQHTAATNLGYHLWDQFLATLTPEDGTVTVYVPAFRTSLGSWNDGVYDPNNNWLGAVYYAEVPGKSLSFTIVPDDASPMNGGFSGGKPAPPPKALPSGNFLNASWAGDPVNVANGNMFRDETDIAYPNIGVPLTFSRHYDSQSEAKYGMGPGWTYSFGDYIYEEYDSATQTYNRVWLDSKGRRHVFKPDGAGSYLVPSSLQGQLTYVAGAADGVENFVFKSSDGLEYYFENEASSAFAGRLSRIIDHNGDGIAVEYTSTAGRNISYVSDVHSTGGTPNRRLAFTYTGAVISQVTKYDNGVAVGTWDYGYAQFAGVNNITTWHLTTVDAPAVQVGNDAYVEASSRPRVEYRYNRTVSHHAQGLITKITEPDGSWHEYEYYVNRRVSRVNQGKDSRILADLSGFTGVGNTSAPNNYTATATSIGGVFDSWRGTGEAMAYLADTSLDVPGGILTPMTDGGFGATGTVTFDASVDNTSIAESTLFRFGFFDKDNPLDVVYGLTVFGASPTSLRFYAGNAVGTPPAIPNGTYTFDIDVNNAESGYRLVRVRLYDYATQALVVDVSNTLGPASTYTNADSFGFIQPHHNSIDSDTAFSFTVTDLDYTGATHLDAEGVPVRNTVDIQSFNYNLHRSQTDFVDERGNVETYLHQDNGLLEKQIHPDRSRIKSTWGAIGAADEYLMASTTDERGAVETFTYFTAADFKKGQLKTSTEKSYTPSTALATTYDYFQPANRPHMAALSTVTVDLGDPIAGYQNIKTSHYYDPEGRLTSTTHANGHDAAGAVLAGYATTRTYYVAADGGPAYRLGLLKSVKQPGIVDAAGNPIQYETVFDYDAAGNVTSTTTRTVAGTPVVVSQETFAYDSMGNVVQRIIGANVIAERVITESIYDTLGRLRQTGFADANAAIDPIDGFTSRYKYDAMGRVRESKDPLGRVTRFEYDRLGNVVKQINSDGTVLLNDYDALGNCVLTTDALGRTTRFVYDSRNRLVQTAYPDGAIERLRHDGAGNVVAKIDALSNVTTFKYDAAGRLLETKLPDPDGPWNDDGGANLTEPTTTNKYDKLGNLIETIDPKFNVTQFKYDKLGRVVQTQTLDDPVGVSRTNQSLTAVSKLVSLTTTDYDVVGNVIESASYDVTQYDVAATATLLADPRAHQTPAHITANKVHVTSMRYDALGRLVKTINADDTTTSTTYDAAGRVKEQKDELLRVTTFVYDQFGRLTQTTLPDPDGSGTAYASPVTSYRYDAVGNRIATIDPRGFTTRFEYDVFNRLVATVDAQGNRTRSVYDVAGQMVATVDALGRASYTLYDERGRAIEQRGADPDGSGAGVAPVTRHRYDDAGRVVESIDALGYSTTYQYDNLGRVIKESFTTGYQVIDSTDPSAFQLIQGTFVTQNSSSDYGGSSKIITPTSVNSVARWNFTGVEPGDYRILVHWSGFATTATGFTYRLSDWYNGGPTDFFPADVDTQWVGRGQFTGSSGDLRFENGVWNDWYQLPIGFQVSAVSPKLSVHLAATGTFQADAVRIERIASRSYTYDANGNLLTETDPRGNQTVYTYDELGRVSTETLPDPDGLNNDDGDQNLINPQTTTTYDGYGNVKRVTERRGTGANSRSTDYVYNLRNRRTEEIFDVNTGGGATYLNRKTTYAYDNVGNLTTKIELPGHATLERRTSYAYDGLNRLWIQADNNIGSIVTADPRERTAIHSYDAAGNLTQTLVNQLGAIDPRQIATVYRYDAVGQLVEQTEQGLVGGVTEKRTTRFQYDAVGQQIAAIDPLLRVSRSDFDRLGRLIKSTDPDPDGSSSLQPHATTFVYDAAGQLIVKNNGGNTTPGTHEIDRYAYDPQGRLIRSEDGRGDVTTRRYDDAGNLVKLVDPAGNATTYVYDNLDRVITETTAAGPRRFYFDDNENLLYSVDRNGRAIRSSYHRDDQVAGTWEYISLAQAQVTGPISQQYIAYTNHYYDDLGRLVEDRYSRRASYGGVFDYRVTDSYRYDGLDRLIEHSNQSIQPDLLHSTDVPALKQTYAYAYDSSSLTVTREQFIGGAFAASTKSSYNAFGELFRLQDSEVGVGGASAILDFESTDAVFSYLGDGALKEVSRYTDWDAALSGGAGHRNRVQSTYAYDGAGRIKNIAHGQSRRSAAAWPANTPLVDFDYEYDAVSRIDEIVTNWNTALTAFSNRTDETQSLIYDGAGQLTYSNSNIPGRSGDYSYGANGNRSMSGENGLAQYAYQNGDNRVTSDAYYSYQYDSEGNLIRRQSMSNADYYEIYTWDHQNRLTKVEDFVGAALVETLIYRYNSADDLVYRSYGTVGNPVQTEHYLVESGRRTMTLETDGDVKRRYQYGPTGDVQFEQVFDEAGNPSLQSQYDLLLPLGDHQHSTRVVVAHVQNEAVHVYQSIDYAPFGTVIAVRNSLGQYATSHAHTTAFRFQGMIHDVEADFYRTSSRVYDPRLGRFISEDPIQDGSNWYAFAGNDPVNYADPSGLFQQGHPLKGGSAKLDNYLRGAVNQAINKPRSTSFDEFNRGISLHSGLSTITRTENPLTSAINETQQARTYRAQQELKSRTVVKIEQLGTGSPGGVFYEAADSFRATGNYNDYLTGNLLSAVGWVADLGPDSQPGKRITYGDGRVVREMGGDIKTTASAIKIPSVAAATHVGTTAVVAAKKAAPTVLDKAKSFFDDSVRYASDKLGLKKSVPSTGREIIEQQAKVAVGGGATTARMSTKQLQEIQEFATRYNVEVTVVGSRVNPNKMIRPGESDWDYLINQVPGIKPTKSLRDVQSSAGHYLPKGRPRTDAFGNTRPGLDIERNVPIDTNLPHVIFRP